MDLTSSDLTETDTTDVDVMRGVTRGMKMKIFDSATSFFKNIPVF